jgi:hypothetical protein
LVGAHSEVLIRQGEIDGDAFAGPKLNRIVILRRGIARVSTHLQIADALADALRDALPIDKVHSKSKSRRRMAIVRGKAQVDILC